jgi:ankyrin repeat protein
MVLLDNGADVNAKDTEGQTLLFRIVTYNLPDDAKEGKIKYIDELIQRGADINIKDKEGRNLLFYCEETDLCSFLISRGVNPKDRDNEGKTPLFFIYNEGTKKYLISAGTNPDEKDNNGHTFQDCEAINNGAYEKTKENGKTYMQMLIDYEIKRNAYFDSPFIVAVKEGNTPKVSAFLKKNPKLANYNLKLESPEKDKEGEHITPLVLAIIYKKDDTARLLIKYDADPDPDVGGGTPLFYAIRERNSKIAQLLLDKGAKIINAKVPNYSSILLSEAIESQCDETVKILLSKGADVIGSGSDCPPIHAAVKIESKKMIELLLSMGADINIRDKNGYAAVSEIISIPDDFVKYMVSKGYNINNKNSYGDTLLHNTVGNNAPEKASNLIKLGAMLNIRNNNGETPLHYAQTPKMAKLLIDAGADVNIKDNSGKTPAMSAELPIMKEFYKSMGISVPKE